ncbi:MAG: glutaminyl-peptide cyclotransferase [Pseudomonadota bacterium]
MAVGSTANAQLRPIKRYGFEVLETVPQSRENFVQGLQIFEGTLYIGTGLYGVSELLEYNFPSMDLRRKKRLSDDLFGEGVTRFRDQIYQLTYRAQKLLVYDAESLALSQTLPIRTEGWGITHDSKNLIYSDGSANLYFLDPGSGALLRTLPVMLNGRPLARLNELEWIDGKVWANVWQANQIIEINARTGVVESVADLRGLLDPQLREEDTDVLNGIAWDAERKQLWVTGKRWPKIYRIRLIELGASRPQTPAPGRRNTP